MTSLLDESALQQAAQSLFDAHQSVSAKPLMSHSLPDLDEADAYKIQAALVSKIAASDSIAGYKAALTNLKAQEMFNADGAAFAVLFASGQYESEDDIRSEKFVVPVLETEIGFRMGRTLLPSEGPFNRKKLEQVIETALPMVEIADVGFTDRLSSSTDLIAANGGSAGFIVGEEPALAVDLNAINISMFMNGELQGQGTSLDAMGDQWDAVTWLVNKVLSQGYEIEAGSYLMTGSLGRIYAGKPGTYRVDYGDFGQINFTLS